MNLKRRKFANEFKLKLVEQVKRGRSFSEVARQYNLSDSVLRRWFKQEKRLKQAGNGHKIKNRTYSKQLKQQAVDMVASGKTIQEVANKLDTSWTVVSNWVKSMLPSDDPIPDDPIPDNPESKDNPGPTESKVIDINKDKDENAAEIINLRRKIDRLIHEKHALKKQIDDLQTLIENQKQYAEVNQNLISDNQKLIECRRQLQAAQKDAAMFKGIISILMEKKENQKLIDV